MHNFKQSISYCVQYNDGYKRIYSYIVGHSVTSIQRMVISRTSNIVQYSMEKVFVIWMNVSSGTGSPGLSRTKSI